MIKIKRARLINWYSYIDEFAQFDDEATFITGDNKVGKSVLLDAINYALFGDTKFNAASEGKNARTVISYMRGYINLDDHTCMRPAKEVSTLCTHIVIELYDDLEKKVFALGTVLEADTTDNIIVKRYILENTGVEDVPVTYWHGPVKAPATIDQLKEKLNVKIYDGNDGVVAFSSRMGLRFGKRDTNDFCRVLRSAKSYKPDVKSFDDFIRTYVLEKKNVDFAKMAEAKKAIDELNQTLDQVIVEMNALDEITDLSEQYLDLQQQIQANEIKIRYQDCMDSMRRQDAISDKKQYTVDQIEKNKKELSELKTKESNCRYHADQLYENLNDMDCTKSINLARHNKEETEHQLHIATEKMSRLNELADCISHIGTWVENHPELNYITDEAKGVLLDIANPDIDSSIKKKWFEQLHSRLKEWNDYFAAQKSEIETSQRECEKARAHYNEIISKCRERKASYFSEIPDYVRLKNDINKEFERRGIHSEALLACEYVLSIDEEWQDAIEVFLGARRYTVLVDPEYYDVADDILIQTKNKGAHLFNTALLNKRTVRTEEDSLMQFLSVKNETAKKYFTYMLGRIIAADTESVRNYENAISKEGKASVGMDNYWLNFNRIRFYCMGRNAVELNQKKAERALEKEKKNYAELQEKAQEIVANKAVVERADPYFTKEYDFDAAKKHAEVATQLKEREAALQSLYDAQANNMEYLQLNESYNKAKEDLEKIRTTINDLERENAKNEGSLEDFDNKISEEKKNYEHCQQKLQEISEKYADIYVSVIDKYEAYLDNGSTGRGGIFAEKTRKDKENDLGKTRDELNKKRSYYHNIMRQDNDFSYEITKEMLAKYTERKNRIKMDSYQEVKQKLREQTERYEYSFKNQVVLRVYDYCERAFEDLKHINRALERLDFDYRYSFAAKYISDGSDMEAMIKYAKILKRKADNDEQNGQMSMTTTREDIEEEERLESIVNGIIAKIISADGKDISKKYADYRNYISFKLYQESPEKGKMDLSKQVSYNSGAEIQIPYTLILLSALMIVYNSKPNSVRLVFMDEPFEKMSEQNIERMIQFMKEQNLQMVFCAAKGSSFRQECKTIMVIKHRPKNPNSVFITTVDRNKKSDN